MRAQNYEDIREDILDHLAIGDTLFTAWKGKGFISKAIRYITGGEVNHVSYIKPEWLSDGSLAQRVLHEEALGHGTVINQLSHSIRKKSVEHVTIYRLKSIKADGLEAHRKALEILSRPYGFKAIWFHYLINRIPIIIGSYKFVWLIRKFGLIAKSEKWIAGTGICSQVGTEIAEAAGITFKNNKIPNWAVDPVMFANWNELEPIWKIRGGGY